MMLQSEDRDALANLIATYPMIDNHSHPIFAHSERSAARLESITSEAFGQALESAKYSLSHHRAVKQLSSLLGIEGATWEEVKEKCSNVNQQDWIKKCFSGVQCALLDDGLRSPEGATIMAWEEHNHFTSSDNKRLVRLERLAEDLLEKHTEDGAEFASARWMDEVWKAISASLDDPKVAGFKSVICYRGGLDVSIDDADGLLPSFEEWAIDTRARLAAGKACRLESKCINEWLINTACFLIEGNRHRKPLQFHTGFGDADINLLKSNPAYLETLVKKYPGVPFVLLHASYPYTRQAGYLATVYHNVYLDFGEVFPTLSKDGQKAVVKEMLELTPADKLLWSTDGHWFPETYALSNMQVREVLAEVLIKRVDRGLLTVRQATDLVKKVFFDNANRLYRLNLEPVSVSPTSTMSLVPHSVRVLDDFLSKHPNTLFFRLQWVDYIGMLRLRVVPMSTMRAMAADPDQSAIYVPTVGLCLLGEDAAASSLDSRGRNAIVPDWSTLRSCESYAPGHASLMCDLRPEPGLPSICPRTVTRNAAARAKKDLDLDILIGFEIEVAFLERDSNGMVVMQPANAHSWSGSTALTPARTQLCDEISTAIIGSGIELLLYHPESGDNQFEFVTGPLPPLAAIDALYHTRQIIEHTAARRGLRATLHPKPFPMQAGSAAHTHFSLANHREKQGAFLGGVLQSLPALCAFGLGAPCSYRRVGDSCWAGGTWVCWGDDNRETPLRRILDKDAHWEIRCVDGTANMYLFIGALIEAGVLGIEESAQFPEPCPQNPANVEVREKYGVAKRLPLNFSDALEELEKEDKLADRIGWTVVKKFCGMGYDEIERHARMKEDRQFFWEVERY